MNKTEQQGREQTRTAGRAKKRPSKVRTTLDAAIEKVDTEKKRASAVAELEGNILGGEVAK